VGVFGGASADARVALRLGLPRGTRGRGVAAVGLCRACGGGEGGGWLRLWSFGLVLVRAGCDAESYL
jgi:hypothetical protein